MSKRRQKSVRAQFETFVPRIETHARIFFRHLKCPETKADKVAETVGLSFKWFVRLQERGKTPERFIGTLASFAARAVRCGRRVCGQEHAKDVLSSQAQQRHSFTVQSLPLSTRVSHEQLHGTGTRQRELDAFEERLQDNAVTPPPDQAAFRQDFPAWVQLFSKRDRRIIKAMMAESRTKDLSAQFGLSQGRISQMRREFKLAWDLY